MITKSQGGAFVKAAIYYGKKDVLAAMKSGRWNIGSIITDEFPLCQLPQAIERAAQVDKALNVVIRY